LLKATARRSVFASNVFEDAEAAFTQLVRTVRPQGTVIASVMTATGSLRYFLPVVVAEVERFWMTTYDHIIATGDLRDIPGTHTCRMFRWPEIEAMIDASPGSLLAASASNCLSLGDPVALDRLEADSERWSWFLDWEATLCREPGVRDAGSHTLFAVQRSA
jgi:hypothetical protein